MKKINTILLGLAVLVSSIATANNKPKTDEFEVDGLKVILRHSVKGTVSARLFVLGGTQNYSKEQEGVESLAMSLAMQSGPASMTKDQFNAATEKIGANLGASSGLDYANMSLNTVLINWEKSWDIFAETVVNPAWREADFEVLKNQMVTASKQNKSNPDSHLQEMVRNNAFPNSDYAKQPSGNEESLAALTLDQVKAHYQKVVNRTNTFLVVVGDISKEELKEQVEKGLGALKAGEKVVSAYSDEKIQDGVFVEDREIETNYIAGVFDAPKKGTDESVYNSVAMSILGDRFFEELRTKRSLSYAPQASSTGYIAHPMNMIYISTTDPKASLEVMVDEVNKVKTDGFEKSELEGKKQEYLTHYYMGQQTNSSISMTLGINEINGGWEKSDSFAEDVLNVSLEDINKVMQVYGNSINWSYLGKEEQVKPEYFTQPVQPKDADK